MRILCLDVGERRVGVAISDPGGILAQPLQVFQPKGRRDLVAVAARLVKKEGAERVVVGLPLLLDGRRGEQARRVEAVAEALQEALSVPVVLWDERFSSAEADEALREAGLRADRRKRRLDMAAAALILQAYLDAGAPL